MTLEKTGVNNRYHHTTFIDLRQQHIWYLCWLNML
jgi:hypothetical protein